MFGRIAHLLDAVEDLDADRRAGRYNPLLATATSPARARAHCEHALRDLRQAVASLDLVDRTLAEALLVTEISRSIDRAFAHASTGHDNPGPSAPACARPHQPPAPAGTERDEPPGYGAECCTDCCCECCDPC